tara:strand:- start:6 stop:1199 length:1194 start_codon:yes stop_codon:yes gene_type:complete
MAEKLSPRLQKMKKRNPKRFAEYMALKKRTGRTSRDAARKTVDKTIKGTPAEKAAIAKGKKAAIKARKEGKSEKAAKALGKKIALDQMKTDRSKTNVEAAWTAATILPLGLGQTARGIRTAYKSGQAVKKLVSDRAKKEAAKKAAAAAKKKAADAELKKKLAAARLRGSVGKQFNQNVSKLKRATTASNKASAAAKKANQASRKATSTVTKGEKAVKAANVKGRGKMKEFIPRTAIDPVKSLRLMTPAVATVARVDSANKKKAADNKEKIMVNKKPKPKVVSAPLPKPKPKRKSKIKDFTDVNEIDYDTDKDEGNGTEERKSLGEAMFGGFKTGDFTPKDQTVKNPFTGKDMELKYEYPDDPDDGMKKGGSIKKNMKKTKIKKRAALRGYGKALRGF